MFGGRNGLDSSAPHTPGHIKESPTSTPHVFRFGVFELDSESGELRRHGLKVRLPDQSFQILWLLLTRAGEVVTREQLRQQLWTSDTFVDFDVGVNSAIRKLREALDDSAENPRFVETLPRRGYRFIASVHPVTAVPAADPLVSTVQSVVSEPPSTPAVSRLRPQWIAAVVLAVVVMSTIALVYQRGWWQRLHAGTAPKGVRSLAVLPFENLTGDAAQDHLVDGITDALTTLLAQAGGFHVVSRTSATQYRSAKKPLPVIARELNVDAVLEGSVVRSGQDMRVTAQLIDAAIDRHIWARSYEGELSAVRELQQKIARAIAAALQNQVTSGGAASGNSAFGVNSEAQDAYLKGAFAMGRQTYEGFVTAVTYFEDAVAREPRFAEAYAALGQAQMQLLFVGPLSPREVVPKAEAAVRTALQIDDTVAQAHRTLAAILTNFYWRWDEGEKEFRRARELAPVQDAHGGTAAALTLIRARRFEEAIAEAERASTQDPRSLNAHMNAAAAYRAAGQHDRAIARLRRALELDSARPRVRFQLGATFVMMGRLDEAIRELDMAVAQPNGNSRYEAYRGYAYARAGRRADAVRILKTLESRARQQYVSSFGIALIYDALGQTEPALTALEQAYRDHAVEFAQMSQYPPFTTIGSDPRYGALMRRIGLPR